MLSSSAPESSRPRPVLGAVLCSLLILGGAANTVAFLRDPPLATPSRVLSDFPYRVDAWRGEDVPYDEALPALLPLVRGALSNIEERGLEASVTGPIPRGDMDTVDLHLRALDPHDRELYAMLGRELVRIAGPQISENARRELLERFQSEVGA